MKKCLLVPAVVALTALSCAEPIAPVFPDPVNLLRGVDGQVVWLDFEGGFWAIETDDGRLDPHETLPEAFRAHGLEVHVAARVLKDLVCFHAAGTIVEVTQIRVR